MDLKRKAYQFLLNWKNKPNHKPLIVEGLRQIGKSYLVDKFAHENYQHVITFDFRHDKRIRFCFNKNLTVDEIITAASVYFPKESFVPYQTAIIFEEIGDCTEARTSLKAFALDKRFDILATGSLLGIDNYRRKKRVPIPTGFEEYLTMTSLDFEEFLWACHTSESIIDELKQALKNKAMLSDALQHYFYEMMKRYIAVGGMPEAVTTFLESNSYAEVRTVQSRLLHDYRDDFGRFIDEKGEESIDYRLQVQLNQIFDSIPNQLARENNNYKFKFTEVGNHGRASQYSTAMNWLEQSGLILKVYNTNAIETPLQANRNENSFKVFLSDIGLLMACFSLADLQAFLTDTLGSRKGAIFENLAAIELHQADFPLYYYGDSERHLEIDFLLETTDGITLVEEKSTNGKMAASKAVMMNQTPYHASKCIKIIDYGFGEGDFFRSIPNYSAFFYFQSEKEQLLSNMNAGPLPALPIENA